MHQPFDRGAFPAALQGAPLAYQYVLKPTPLLLGASCSLAVLRVLADVTPAAYLQQQFVGPAVRLMNRFAKDVATMGQQGQWPQRRCEPPASLCFACFVGQGSTGSAAIRCRGCSSIVWAPRPSTGCSLSRL